MDGHKDVAELNEPEQNQKEDRKHYCRFSDRKSFTSLFGSRGCDLLSAPEKQRFSGPEAALDV